MPICKYCHQSASLFSAAHKECQTKHTAGVEKLRSLLKNHLSGTGRTVDLHPEILTLRKNNFLQSQDILSEFIKALDAYTAAIHRPFGQPVLQKVTSLVSAIDEPYASLNRDGAISRFVQKIIKGNIAQYFTGQQNIAATQSSIQTLTQALPIPPSLITDTYYYMLDKAATNFLKDGLLSPQEERLMNDYTASLGLQLTTLPATYQNGNIAKIAQAGILKSLQNGQLPAPSRTYPILLGRGESVLWLYDNVQCYEEKVQREYHSNRGGLSIKIAKGVYYRPSTSRTRPVEHSYMNLEGTGSLYITNKHLIFNCPTKGLKIPYAKIIGVTPYSDGIELNRDGSAKRLILQGFDSWFLLNLLSMINTI